MKNMATAIVLVVLILLGIVASEALYAVYETERVIITQFGKPIGDVIDEAKAEISASVDRYKTAPEKPAF